jgi:hypothetical protein
MQILEFLMFQFIEIILILMLVLWPVEHLHLLRLKHVEFQVEFVLELHELELVLQHLLALFHLDEVEVDDDLRDLVFEIIPYHHLNPLN